MRRFRAGFLNLIALAAVAAFGARAADAGFGLPAAPPPLPAIVTPKTPPSDITPSPATPEPAPPDWLSKGTAQIQALNKIDNRHATIDVPVGGTGHFGRLDITVKACLIRPPTVPQDAAAWLEITDPSVTATGPNPGTANFKGWMLAAEPSVSMLEHPVYDVRVIGCR